MTLPVTGYVQQVEIVVGGNLPRAGFVQPVEIVGGGGGGITGGGVAGQIAFFTAATVIAGDAGLTYDSAGNKITILGTGGPQQRWAFDGSNYVEAECDLTGDLYLRPTGNTVLVQSTTGTGELFIDGFGAGSSSFIYLSHDESNIFWSLYREGTTQNFRVDDASDTRLRIYQTTGNVGFGSSSENMFWDQTNLKLTISGASPSLAVGGITLSGSAGAHFIESTTGASAAVSGAATGRIRYNNTAGSWQVSVQGGAYVNLATGSGMTIGGAVVGGTAARILFVDTGPVLAQSSGLLWEATNVTLTNTILKVVSAYNQIHFANVAGNGGGWVGSTGDSQAWLSGGMHYSGSGSNWVCDAAAGDPCYFDIGGGELTFYGDTGITPGATFAPSRIANFRRDTGIVFDVVLSVTAGGITYGANPAVSGAYRTANNVLMLAARNAGNSADIWGVYIDGSNQIHIGHSSGANAGLLLQNDAAGKIGFFAGAPVVKQTSGENLTNNVASGGTDGTIANFTDLTVYANDAATIRNDIYQLARKLKQVNDGMRTYALLT